MITFVKIWLSLSVLIAATGWYLHAAIRPAFPDWYRRHILDDRDV